MSKNISSKLIESIAAIIEEGVRRREFKRDADPELLAREIFSIIEGAMFMANTHEDETFILEAMDLIDNKIIDPIIR